MRIHYMQALVFFLLGVVVANRVGFLAPIAGQKG